MKPVMPEEELGGVPLVIAENQPPYLPLPARTDGEQVVTMWEFTDEEKAAIAAGAELILYVTTFGQPLSPLHLEVRGCEAPTT